MIIVGNVKLKELYQNQSLSGGQMIVVKKLFEKVLTRNKTHVIIKKKEKER
jgi:hypothetical protein